MAADAPIRPADDMDLADRTDRTDRTDRPDRPDSTDRPAGLDWMPAPERDPVAAPGAVPGVVPGARRARPRRASGRRGTGGRRPGPAVLLRSLIGVREDVLGWVPEERTRYTWYGAIVLNTALLGGASMALAIATIRDELPLAVALVVAVIWFWVVLAVDSWLVSSTHGVPAKGRLRSLLPRLFLSVLLGLAIAEPLLFQIFDKEIQQEIAVGHQREVESYRGSLMACNPVDGTATAGRPECAGFQLNVPGSPGALREQITRNAAEVKERQAQVTAMNKTLADKMATEQRECDYRTKYVWKNGGRDVTETCKRARKDATAYSESSQADKHQSDLTALIQKGRDLTAQEATAGETYRPALVKAIDDRTRSHARSLDDDGLLTRAHALGAVAWSDWYAGFVAVLLHILLLTVDAMPVLAKLMSGPTSYDRALTARLEAGRRRHAEELQVRHACEASDHEARRHRSEREAANRMDSVEHAYRLEQSERARAFHTELNARAARLRNP
ncbi:DUF4407 domain-containing protein [Streptomyces sp. NPDC051211]|uniref:DUF4407 domain-containing protein n=1 Tax=Streptomyces sp. NPDC051211 TaxID=3154643 RepID=UPI00344C76A4